MAPKNVEAVNPPDVAPPIGGYAHALVLPADARLIIVSGQTPTNLQGNVPTGFEAQCCAVWDNIGHVLRGAGADFDSLVKVTTFLTRAEDAELNGAIRRRYLGEHRPALTVIVAATLDSAWLLEIEAFALVQEKRG